MTGMNLGRFGFSVDVCEDGRHLLAAAEIERLGFGTLWITGGQLDRLDRLTDLLGATRTAAVGSAIISPDVYCPADVREIYARAEAAQPGRLLVGLGSAQRAGALGLLVRYLDDLAAVPRDRRLLAAQGPRALGFARDEFAGAMPMLFTPAQTAAARRVIGPDRVLAVGLYAVVDDAPNSARATAREPLRFLTSLPGYRKSLVRQRFSEDDIAQLSDRLVDSLVAWGGPHDIAGRVEALHTAGADHVHLTVLGGSAQPTGVAAARILAPVLTSLLWSTPTACRPARC